MKKTTLSILSATSYFAMVYVNFLANSLPINNRSTGEISDAYQNLFAPAGLTFSIWGLIYLLLGGFVVYQFIKKDQKTDELISKINPLFILSSIANILWIFAWHYDYIGISVLIMSTMLFLLIKIAGLVNKDKLTFPKNILVRTPFSVYFGWITVATIANITVFLVSLGWNGFGIADFIWTAIILVIGATIGIARINKDKNRAYGLVLVWAYSGILLKHLSVNGFQGQYPLVIITTIICLLSFLFFIFKRSN